MMSRAERLFQLAKGNGDSVAPEISSQVLHALKDKDLFGNSDLDEIEVVQWLMFSKQNLNENHLMKLNATLAFKSYLVGQRFSLADAAVLLQLVAQHVVVTAESAPHLSRWFNHVVYFIPNCGFASIFAETPVVVPLPLSANAVKEQDGVEQKIADKIENSATTNPAEKLSGKVSQSDVSIDELDPSKLDMRVGLVVKCWNHPDSEKLLCEEIDLGEGTHRLIASGIRVHYTAEHVQGRKVLVLANLKERSIAGFKSQGMVLCASNADHSDVKLVEPPSTAKVGDRVVFAGFSGEPATAAQVAKKKIFESLAPFLRTDDQGVVHWKSSCLTIGGDVCKAPLGNAQVA